MVATKKMLGRWFDAGKKQGATHMIVVCDTYDHSDYPVYVSANDDAYDKAKEQDEKSMQRVMEVYDLRLDKDVQLSEHRAFHY